MDKIGRRLIGNSAWLFLDKIVRLIVGLFIGVLVARYLGPANVGIWNYCIAIFTFFIIFPSLGLEYVSPREFVNNKGQEEKLLNTALTMKFVGATVGMVSCVLFMGFIKGFDSYLIPFIFILTTGYIFQSFDIIDYYYQSKLEQKKTVIAKMIAFLLVSIYKFYLVQSGASLIWFIAASSIEFGLAAIGLIYTLRKSPVKINLNKFDIKLAKSLLNDSLVFALSALVIVIYFKVDQVMVTEILGEQENGIYSVAIRIYELFTYIPAVLVTSFLPVITQKYNDNEIEFRASLKQLYSVLTYLSIIFSLGVWIFGPWVMNFLYGSEFAGSGEILQFIGIGFYSVFMGMGIGNYLIIRNRKKFVLLKSLAGLLVNIGLNLWLIPIYGIKGAVIASLISNFISTFLILALNDNDNHWQLILSPFNISSIRRFLKY